MTLDSWASKGNNLRENVRKANRGRKAAQVRHVNVPDEPMLCGSCVKHAVTRTETETTATYSCSSCGKTRTIKRRWECSEARAEAMLMDKPVSRQGA